MHILLEEIEEVWAKENSKKRGNQKTLYKKAWEYIKSEEIELNKNGIIVYILYIIIFRESEEKYNRNDMYRMVGEKILEVYKKEIQEKHTKDEWKKITSVVGVELIKRTEEILWKKKFNMTLIERYGNTKKEKV